MPLYFSPPEAGWLPILHRKYNDYVTIQGNIYTFLKCSTFLVSLLGEIWRVFILDSAKPQIFQ